MKKFKSTLLVILLLAFVLVGAGCFGGKYSTPKKTIQTLYKAVEQGDKETYLNSFSEGTVKLFEESGQEIDMEAIKKTMPEELPEAEVIEQEGDTAVVQTKAMGSMPMVMKKENGQWKIDMEATIKRSSGQ